MYSYTHPHPSITADCVILAQEANVIKVLLIQRKNNPYKGFWAFPGGFMNIDETTEDAARRELKEETGLTVDVLEQIGAFSKVDRDPRERVVTIAYATILSGTPEIQASDDAKAAQWFDIHELPALAFDHDEILSASLSHFNL